MDAHDNYCVVTEVDTLIRFAISQAASDVHLESLHNGLRIRLRLDGILYDHAVLPSAIMAQVLSRIKVLAAINIAERRLPHDGKFCIEHNNTTIDIRVSTFPSLYGEKMVLRILDRAQTTIQLDSIGFMAPMLQHCKQILDKTNGFFLVTGPTGSGKTTTLYAALAHLNAPDKNIITLEDPIEYNLDGITQGAVHTEIGFTFARGIRSVLRQDPDIIMVGEIRDRETAQVAIQAALTGHLVLSTIHTSDAVGVIVRLLDMGVEPFLINAALTGVLAQRLARKLCTVCKRKYNPSQEELDYVQQKQLLITEFYTAPGCEHCNHRGYKGRTGVFELLLLSDALKALIKQQPSVSTLYSQALNDGMQLLIVDGASKVQEGIISLQELVRIS